MPESTTAAPSFDPELRAAVRAYVKRWRDHLRYERAMNAHVPAGLSDREFARWERGPGGRANGRRLERFSAMLDRLGEAESELLGLLRDRRIRGVAAGRFVVVRHRDPNVAIQLVVTRRDAIMEVIS